MRLIFILFIFIFIDCHGQTISSFAGNGAANNLGDGGLATAAGLDYPCLGVFDKIGNYYFTTGVIGNTVRKISPSGVICTVAGTGSLGFNGDNIQATTAKLWDPCAVAVDSMGNIYVADRENQRIRKIDFLSGLITTIAGTGVEASSGDHGLATAASIMDPNDICFDKFSNLYFSENGDGKVRKIDGVGIITTVAGTGLPGHSSGGGLADTTPLGAVGGICFDDTGNLYIADWYSRVYKVDTFGFITTIVGNGVSGSSGDDSLAINCKTVPAFIALDKFGNLYISEYDYNKVRMVNNAGIIKTIVGTGISGYNGDNILANSALLNAPAGLNIDSCGNLFIADSRNFRIRKVSYPNCDYMTTQSIENQHNRISLYPNPATSKLYIDGANGGEQWVLFNITGIIEQSGKLQEGHNEIPIKQLPPGLKILEILTGHGQKTIKKFLKD